MPATSGMNYAPKGKVMHVVGEGEFTFAAIGLNHGHIYGMTSGLIEAGGELKWVWDPDPAIHGPAAVAWSTWEAATTSLVLDDTHVSEFADPHYALAFARIENHYFVNHGFMAEGQLIRNAGRLAAIPTTIVQGRYDMCCPATSAYDLKQALPSADLRMVLAGHSAFEPLIASELVKVCDEYADL